MDLIWRSEKIIKFGADLIWRSEKKIKFGDFCHFAPIAPNFLRAKIYLNKVYEFWGSTFTIPLFLLILLFQTNSITTPNFSNLLAYDYWYKLFEN